MTSIANLPPPGDAWDAEAYESHLRRVLDLAGISVPEVVLPASRHIVVDGLRLHYLDWGGDGTAPLLFLHGGGLSAHTWDVVALAMRRRFHCLALDLRGHGESEWSRSLDYTIDEHTADIVGFLDGLGIERVVLVGMSLGGIVSMSVALDHPARVAALTLVDVGPPADPVGVARVNTFMKRAESFASIDDAIEAAIAYSPKRDRRLLAWTLRRNLMQLADGTLTWKYDRRNRTTTEHVDRIIARNRELAERIEELACPMLLVYGERSDVLSAADAEAFVRRVHDGRIAGAPDAGHSVQGDNPAALVAELDRFFDEIPGVVDALAHDVEGKR
jgi:pimeloyl-ACP methyl ester carboxylesterase